MHSAKIQEWKDDYGKAVNRDSRVGENARETLDYLVIRKLSRWVVLWPSVISAGRRRDMLDAEAGASSAAGPSATGRLLFAARRQSSDPAVDMRASCAQLADDAVDDTSPGSAAGHVTGSTLAYPGFVERAFFVLDQTSRPRSWCLRLITWPYPLLLNFLFFCLWCRSGFTRHNALRQSAEHAKQQQQQLLLSSQAAR